MKKILITTKPDDTHALFVKLALEKMGHQADLWYTTDYPIKLSYTFEFIAKKFNWAAKGLDCKASKHNYDVVWYRRPGKPVLPDYLHEDDIYNARKENLMFSQNIWQVIYPDAHWINPVSSFFRANSKLLQLKYAVEAGLKIPETVITNDPDKIKQYITKHKDKIIYKTIYPMTWLGKNEVRLTYASHISLNDLPSDKLLQCTPGIFQERIKKKYELRVTFFGINYIAVKIYSQLHDQARTDWRAAPTHELMLVEVPLPDKIYQACRMIMTKLGIVFGCFDLIVTPDDEYYFLEVNEQGQFLWIEDVNPDIRMLQAFCNFIVTIDNDYDKLQPSVFMSEFNSKANEMRQEAMRLHVNPAH